MLRLNAFRPPSTLSDHPESDEEGYTDEEYASDSLEAPLTDELSDKEFNMYSVLVIAWVAVKFGINIMSVVLEMVNFTRLCLVKFILISNTTLMVFIPNFTATHAIPS